MKLSAITNQMPKQLGYLREIGGEAMASKISQSTSMKAPSFVDYLSSQVHQVNDKIVAADQRVADVATGKSQNLHEMMVALNKADLSLKMLTQVRNKAVEAYQELMRMSL
jgi:flagellar hook-basal body complex protein FliE